MTRSAGLLALLIAIGPSARVQEAPPEPPRARARILLLGTFHFDDAGLDDYKPEHRIDILAPERQREIEEVARCLAKFRPTKVAVEAPLSAGERLNERYKTFVAGQSPLGRNEIDQLGFRVAKAMGHPRVYPVDAEGRRYEPEVDLRKYAAEKGQLERLTASETPWDEYFNALYRRDDARKARQTIRQTLLDGNREEHVLRGHGAYLVRSFKVGVGNEYPGVDAVTAWYNRNLRIFANLQRITDGPEERILLIIGGGHVPILWHAVEASPEYIRVDVEEVLGSICDAAPGTPERR
ncbi:MAG: DUF5694 domain-containing protein [Planctomycetes bacterium]|nr:DUF5694 domain-containing protein [Planctomycetota bacterium]